MRKVCYICDCMVQWKLPVKTDAVDLRSCFREVCSYTSASTPDKKYASKEAYDGKERMQCLLNYSTMLMLYPICWLIRK